MSQRAAWQLERLGFSQVHDFVVGKAHWLASARPTVQTTDTDRVGDRLSDSIAAALSDPADDVLKRIDEHATSVVVVDATGVVYGRARRTDLEGAGSAPVADIMRLGPTTIRPDEPAEAVAERMRARGVPSLLVTKPTGQLLGEFTLTETSE